MTIESARILKLLVAHWTLELKVSLLLSLTAKCVLVALVVVERTVMRKSLSASFATVRLTAEMCIDVFV